MRRSIFSPGLLGVFAATAGTTTSFYLLLTVVPLYATTIGAGDTGAGFTTGALMFSTVAAELAAPTLLARFGYRLVLAVGLVLLGVPALLLPMSRGFGDLLVISIVRGLGFAIEVVAGSALVALLVPPERRGEGLGIYGVVVGIPGIVALPLGVWLAGAVGYSVVFIAGAAAALVGLLAMPAIPHRLATVKIDAAASLLVGLRSTHLLRPSIVFMTTATAAGAVLTFLPLAVAPAISNLVPLALLLHSAAATSSRWWAGRYGDAHGSQRLIVPALFLSAVGIAMLVLTSSPVAVMAGMVLFGLGFGVSQNASLAMMFQRVSSGGFGTVSAMWNLAYDMGLGVGGAGFGLVVVATGYPVAFALTAAVMFAALLPAVVDGRHSTR